METSSKKRIIILSAIGILLTSLICLFAFRNVILCHIVDKRTTRAEQTYGLQIHYQELRMKGCNEVALQGLSIVPNQRDTLLTLQTKFLGIAKRRNRSTECAYEWPCNQLHQA